MKMNAHTFACLFLLFSRASAEFRKVTEGLSAEPCYAGADWLLHSHGGVLHERVCQQGVMHIHLTSCCHVFVHYT